MNYGNSQPNQYNKDFDGQFVPNPNSDINLPPPEQYLNQDPRTVGASAMESFSGKESYNVQNVPSSPEPVMDAELPPETIADNNSDEENSGDDLGSSGVDVSGIKTGENLNQAGVKAVENYIDGLGNGTFNPADFYGGVRGAARKNMENSYEDRNIL